MKLHMHGITGKTHRWIVDFLGNRTQEVVVNESKSERGMVKSGVPQVTVFGPEHIGRLARMSVLDTEVDGSNLGSSMLFP